jgi:hypothetical protein
MIGENQMTKNTYIYVEDNGGGLHLFVLKNGKVVDGITDLSYAGAGEWHNVKDDMMQDALAAVRGWDSHMKDLGINPEAFYAECMVSEYGYEIVADNNGIYPSHMGRAAEWYFGIKNE